MSSVLVKNILSLAKFTDDIYEEDGEVKFKTKDDLVAIQLAYEIAESIGGFCISTANHNTGFSVIFFDDEGCQNNRNCHKLYRLIKKHM